MITSLDYKRVERAAEEVFTEFTLYSPWGFMGCCRALERTNNRREVRQLFQDLFAPSQKFWVVNDYYWSVNSKRRKQSMEPRLIALYLLSEIVKDEHKKWVRKVSAAKRRKKK